MKCLSRVGLARRCVRQRPVSSPRTGTSDPSFPDPGRLPQRSRSRRAARSPSPILAAAAEAAWYGVRISPSMQIQVRHDDTIQGNERLAALTEAAIESALARFAEHITTVEVHFADENGKKVGGDDVRCSIEVRFEGRKPTGVSHHASDLEVALEAAADKMARMLDHQLGRIRDQAPPAPPSET
jgi:ribosome-associated translation inhibitor RaiA